jgi:hypothetical protein
MFSAEGIGTDSMATEGHAVAVARALDHRAEGP